MSSGPLAKRIGRAIDAGLDPTETDGAKLFHTAMGIGRAILAGQSTWWQKEGLAEPCPNWQPETRRCNCKACRARRQEAKCPS